MTTMARAPKTTKFVKPVKTIADIVALERSPYDEVIPSRNLYQVFEATALLHADRPALTVMKTGDPEETAAHLSHGELLARITQAANLFRSLGVTADSGAIAFLCPALAQIPAALLGAQVAGVASTINYLLTADAVADLLIAENAEVLVIPSQANDPETWQKGKNVIERVPSLRFVLVIGGESDPSRKMIGFDAALAAQDDVLEFQLTADRDTVCALFHTGGTTGRPKLVRLTHGNQIHAAWSFLRCTDLTSSTPRSTASRCSMSAARLRRGCPSWRQGAISSFPRPTALEIQKSFRITGASSSVTE
jgi:fatty-acyl-CoA synthase